MKSTPTPYKSLLEWAKTYIEVMGWYIFLVWGYNREMGCCHCGNPQCTSPGKHPIGSLHPNGFKDATQNILKLEEWIKCFPSCGLAIRTGEISNLFVVDVDGDTGENFVKKYIPEILEEPTPMVRTGSGNLQIYFSYPDDLKNRSCRTGILGAHSKVDVRGDGGYVVAPPTSGTKVDYSFLLSPQLQSPAKLPVETIETLNGIVRKSTTLVNGLDSLPRNGKAEEIPEGTRHDRLLSFAGHLVNLGLSSAELSGSIQSVNLYRCKPPLPEIEVRRLADDVAKRYSKTLALAKRSFALTDYGNAERLAQSYGEELRFIEHLGWAKWDGKRWQRDRGSAVRTAKQVVRDIYVEAQAQDDEGERKKIALWAFKCESKARIESILALAESEILLSAKIEQFDSDPFLLNCQNGILDLSTGGLYPHDPRKLMTRIVCCDYDPSATCPTWLKFLNRIMAGNAGLIEFLQQAVGYSLTGDTSEQSLFFCHGDGANGKSTLLETLRQALGTYAQQADFTTFLMRHDAAIRNDIARMVGTRFVTAIEVGDNRRFSEALLKQLTGGDTVTARFLFKEFFEFRPAFKVFLAANHKPIIKGTDHAIWRRIRLIPFSVTIPEKDRDPKLSDKLKKELPGILAWAVQGCLKWQQRGLQIPPEVTEATKTYRNEMDLINEFLTECCILDSSKLVPKSALYNIYEQWCKEAGERPESKRSLGSRLIERGFDPNKKDENGNRIWSGIGLKSDNLT